MSWPWPPLCSCTHPGTNTFPVAWDAGLTVRPLRTVAPVEPLIPLAQLRNEFLRVVNGTVEDSEIESMLIGATEEAEEMTQRALMPQTWQMTLSGFPTGDIVIERPPLIEVTSFVYTDTDGNPQTLAVSPLDFQVIPSSQWRKARLRPLSGASWPSTITTEDAVTITYEAGYSNINDPQLEWIKRGVRVLIGEMYKQRSLTVVGTSIVPAPLDMTRFFRRVY
jgi:uncharacterized phiE125 gp8 family phage protein